MSRCLHCGFAYYRPNAGEPWPEADQCSCGRNDNGQPKATAAHGHRCATKGCPNYYVCTSRDCRLDWQCPTCEDNELFSDIERLDALTHATH